MLYLANEEKNNGQETDRVQERIQQGAGTGYIQVTLKAAQAIARGSHSAVQSAEPESPYIPSKRSERAQR